MSTKISQIFPSIIPSYLIIAAAITWLSSGRLDPVTIIGLNVAILFGLFMAITIGIQLGRLMEKRNVQVAISSEE